MCGKLYIRLQFLCLLVLAVLLMGCVGQKVESEIVMAETSTPVPEPTNEPDEPEATEPPPTVRATPSLQPTAMVTETVMITETIEIEEIEEDGSEIADSELSVISAVGFGGKGGGGGCINCGGGGGGQEIAVIRAPRVTAVPDEPTPTPSDESPTETIEDTPFDNEREEMMTETLDDNLSTFAIDVDTGSYTVHRSNIQVQKLTPDPDDVRVEEFINFFDYDYTPPEEQSFAIYHEAAPAPYGETADYHLLRVGIQGYEVPDDERPPVLLIFVIDVSGSMSGSGRLGLVKQSLALLVDALNEDDRVGIVVYGSDARVVLKPTAVNDRTEIINAINDLETEGATNADAGIREAYQMADESRRSDEQARLIVLSDGVANVGRTTAEAVLENAEQGISLSTFGFGMGSYNDTFMEQLADQGDGTYAYIDTLREADRVFVKDMTGTLITIAKDAKIQVEFDRNAVARYRLIGYENRDVADEDFRDDTVDAGEIGAGHSVTALYEFRLRDGVDEDETAVTTRLRYEDVRTGEVVEIEEPFRAADIVSYADSSESFKLSAMVAEYGELLAESVWAEENTLDTVRDDTEALTQLAREDEEVEEWLLLMDGIANIEDE